jgi:hypothetical protein
MQTVATVASIEPPLFRKLEDLTNELAYIQHYPERFTHVERLARKVSVLQQIKHVRWLLAHWAMPVEQEFVA